MVMGNYQKYPIYIGNIPLILGNLFYKVNGNIIYNSTIRFPDSYQTPPIVWSQIRVNLLPSHGFWGVILLIQQYIIGKRDCRETMINLGNPPKTVTLEAICAIINYLRERRHQGPIFAVLCDVFVIIYAYLYSQPIAFCSCLFLFFNVTLFLLHCYLLYISFGSGKFIQNSTVGVEIDPYPWLYIVYSFAKQNKNRPMASSKFNLCIFT